MDVTYYGNELYHHGILGQKWGVRRYQNADGSYKPGAEGRYDPDHQRVGYSGSVFKTIVNSLSSSKDIVKDAKIVNGGETGHNYAYNRQYNCSFCSMSYEFRRRGINVRAQASPYGYETHDSAIWNSFEHKGSDIKETANRTKSSNANGMTDKEYSVMLNDILKDGKNSRGILTLKWNALENGGSSSGGHMISYEVKNGRFHLVDAQIGKVLTGKEAYSDYLKYSHSIHYMRTDNKSIKGDAQQYFSEKNNGKIKTSLLLKACKNSKLSENMRIRNGKKLYRKWEKENKTKFYKSKKVL